MQRLKRIIDFALAIGAVVSATVMLIVVTLQVVSRVALPQAPTWTEEVARMAFIYMISFAAGLGITQKAYVGFDALLKLLSQRGQVVSQIILHLIIATLMAVILWYSIAFTFKSAGKSPALGLPMIYVFASMCLLSGSSLLYCLFELMSQITAYRKAPSNS